MDKPIMGTFHGDDGKDYRARLLHDVCGVTALLVKFPKRHPAHRDEGTTLHYPSDRIDLFFTPKGAKRSKRSAKYGADQLKVVGRLRGGNERP
jgi:hypothetical protein